jgi:hypothetical protein
LALSSLDVAINNYGAELDIILGNALLLKGKIHDLLGERNTAVEYYRNCIQLDNYSYAIKEAEQYINKPFIK